MKIKLSSSVTSMRVKMTYKNIKDFCKRLKFHEYITVSGKSLQNKRQVEMPVDFSLIKAFSNGKQFDITNDMFKWVKSTIPEEFINNQMLVIYKENTFWTLDFHRMTAIPTKEAPTAEKIFDLNRASIGHFANRLTFILDMLNEEIEEYESSSEYDPKYYTKIEKVETPNNTYDHNYSLTRNEVEKMDEWCKKHSKKYHKPRYTGAVDVSNYEVRFGSTSIGCYADCICTECEKEYEASHDEEIRKRMSYSLRDL